MVKSRLALGSPGWSFVRSFVTMPKIAQYTRKWLLTSDYWSCPKWNSDNKTRKEEWMVQPVFSIVDNVSFFVIFKYLFDLPRWLNWLVKLFQLSVGDWAEMGTFNSLKICQESEYQCSRSKVKCEVLLKGGDGENWPYTKRLSSSPALSSTHPNGD